MTPRSPAAFVVLVFALAIPFYLFGAIHPVELLPGLPLAALQALLPGVVAAILVARGEGSAGVIRLVRRAFDARRIPPRWYPAIVLPLPALSVASYWLLRWMGTALPSPRIALGQAAALLALFVAFAVAEELGWTAYLLEPLEQRWGPMAAALTIGVLWAAWHLVPLAQVGRPADWVAGWCLGTVASRVIMVSLYHATGQSVFATVLFHAMGNLSWQLFPDRGSHYDPRLMGLLLAGMAVAVLVACGPGRRADRDGRRERADSPTG